MGPYGVGAFLLATNALVFEAWRFRGRPAGRRALVALTSLIVAVLAYDGWAWTRPESESRTLRVALIQPNVPLSIKHDRQTFSEQWAKLQTLTTEAAEDGADLIIWPETARPLTLFHDLSRPERTYWSRLSTLTRAQGLCNSC